MEHIPASYPVNYCLFYRKKWWYHISAVSQTMPH